MIVASHQERVEQDYNVHARVLPDIKIDTNVTIQDSCTKLWEIYSVVMDIGPYRHHYHIRTPSRHVLVRNRQFLHRHVPYHPLAQTKENQHKPL